METNPSTSPITDVLLKEMGELPTVTPCWAKLRNHAKAMETRAIEAELAFAAAKMALIHSFSWLGCENCTSDAYCDVCQSQKQLIENVIKQDFGRELRRKYYDIQGEVQRLGFACDKLSNALENQMNATYPLVISDEALKFLQDMKDLKTP